MEVPKYSELPSVPGRPMHCSWDVWNKVHEAVTGRKGEKDWVGTLNHLSREIVAAAGKEIQTGDRVALKYVGLLPLMFKKLQFSGASFQANFVYSNSWPLDAYTYVGFQRKKVEFDLIDGEAITGGKFLACDDQVLLTHWSPRSFDENANY